jgi:hypothetical protein
VVEQFDAARVQRRQDIAIEVGLRLRRHLVVDAMPTKGLARPLPAEPVPRDHGDAVGAQQRRVLLHDLFRAKGGLRFPDRIDHRDPPVLSENSSHAQAARW